MQATDVPPSRLVAAREAGLDFLDGVPREVRVGAVTSTTRCSPSSRRQRIARACGACLEGLRSSGGTATGEALTSSLGLLEQTGPAGVRRPRRRAPLGRRLDARPRPAAAGRRGRAAEGADLHGRAGHRRRDDRGGDAVWDEQRPVPPDRETLRRLAETSGGRYFEADDQLELNEVYERLGSQVATRDEPREITAASPSRRPPAARGRGPVTPLVQAVALSRGCCLLSSSSAARASARRRS